METLTLPATLEALAQINLFITNAIEETGLDERSAWQVQLAVDEAATNIIQHAYDNNEPGDIILSWHCDSGSFTVKLCDRGRGFDPNAVPKPDILSPLEERQIGGLGIYLMTRLMDEVHFDFNPQAGNLVTMVKHIPSNAVNDIAVLSLQGRLDALAEVDVKKKAQILIEKGARRLLVDLSNVILLSSSGLRALLLVRKELMTLGGEMRLAAAQPQVREVLDMTGFGQVFAMHNTIDEARRAFGQD